MKELNKGTEFGRPLGMIFINRGVLLSKKGQYRQAEDVLSRVFDCAPPVKPPRQADANFAFIQSVSGFFIQKAKAG